MVAAAATATFFARILSFACLFLILLRIGDGVIMFRYIRIFLKHDIDFIVVG